MVGFNITSIKLAVGALALLVTATTAQAQQNLQEAAQNPIADLISLPLQNNTNFNVGRSDNTQNVLDIQPVIPLHLNADWNLVTRWIMPVIDQPPFFSGRDLDLLETVAGPGIGQTQFGLGDFTPEIFFSPVKPIQLGPATSMVWGVGPAFQLPTATNNVLGTGKWSAGPGIVTFISDESLHLTYGFVVNNLWSFAGDQDRANVNAMTLQWFANYNMAHGWYLTTSPLITANWEADSKNVWTVPLGGGFGRIFRIGGQPINANIAAYYNVVTPELTGPSWQLRSEFTFLFPTEGHAPPKDEEGRPLKLPLEHPPAVWNGFYIGGNVGSAWPQADVNTVTRNALVSGLPSNVPGESTRLGTGSVPLQANGFIGGGQVGYDDQFAGAWVIGLAADIQGLADADTSALRARAVGLGSGTPGIGVITSSEGLDWLGTVRGRLGFLVAPTFLAYATGGLAYGEVNSSTKIAEAFGSPSALIAQGTSFGSSSDTRVGWTVGGGIAWKFASHWTADGQYLYYDLGNTSYNLSPLKIANGATVVEDLSQSTANFTGQIARLGINYHFN